MESCVDAHAHSLAPQAMVYQAVPNTLQPRPVLSCVSLHTQATFMSINTAREDSEKKGTWLVYLPASGLPNIRASPKSVSFIPPAKRASTLICMQMSQCMHVQKCHEHRHCRMCLFCVPILMSAL